MYFIGLLILIVLIWYLFSRLANLERSAERAAKGLKKRLDALESRFQLLQEKVAQVAEAAVAVSDIYPDSPSDAPEPVQTEPPLEPPPTPLDVHGAKPPEGPVVIPPPPTLPPEVVLSAGPDRSELRSKPEPEPRPEPTPEQAASAFRTALASEGAPPVTRRPPRTELLKQRASRKSFSWKDLEDLLGGNWLNRVGVGVLVMGVSLLLGYTFENLGPIGKLLIGYLVTVSLLGGGSWLERKKQYSLYGKALIGGGWALGYFTTFALHFVEAVRVIDQEVWGLVVLGLYTAVMIAYSLRYKSELVTGIAAILGVVTIELSSVDFFDLTAILLLTVFVVVCCTRFGWFYLGLFGALATYAVHLQWQFPASPELYSTPFWGSLFLLGGYWLLYLVPAFFVAPRNVTEGTLLQGINLVNVGSMVIALVHLCATQDLRFAAMLILGTLYVGLVSLANKKGLRTSYLTFSTFAAGLLIAAMAIRFTGDTLALTWLLESELLLALGLLQREKYFRLLGYIGLGLSLGVLVVFGGSTGTFAIFAAVLYSNRILGTRLLREEGEQNDVAVTDLFTYAAAFLAASALWKWVELDHLAPAWSLLGIFVMAIGIKAGINHVRYQGYGVLYIAATTMLSLLVRTKGETLVWQALVVAGVLYSTSCLIRWVYGKARIDQGESLIRHGYTHFGTLLVTVLIFKVFPDLWIAPAIAGLAVALAEIERRWQTEHLRAQVYVLAFVAFVTFGSKYLGVTFLHEPLYLRVIAAGLVVLALYYLFGKLRQDVGLERISGPEKHLAEPFSVEAAVLALIVMWVELPTIWIAPATLAFAALLTEVEKRWPNVQLRAQVYAMGFLGFASFSLRYLGPGEPVQLAVVRWIAAVLVIGLLYHLFLKFKKLLAEAAIPGQEKYFIEALSFEAAIATAILLDGELRTVWVPVAWGVLSLVAYFMGNLVDDPLSRFKAYLLLAATVGRTFVLNLWIGAPAFEETAKLLSVVLVLLILWVWYGSLLRTVRAAVAAGDRNAIEVGRLVMTMVACSIGLMGAVLLYQEVPTRQLTVAWGMEALLLFAVGLWLRQRDLRLLGLGFLSFCVLKVFFYDLSGLEGLPRIVSFIVLGLILLLVSYLYTRFSQTLRRYL